MAYEYYGHEANVLPDNTQALLHFSNLFEKREAQKAAEKAAQQKAEQERRIRLMKYAGDRMSAKNYSPTVDVELGSSLADIQRRILAGEDESKMMGLIDEQAGSLSMLSQKIKDGEAKMAQRIAELSKEDPYLDATALGNIASINFHNKKDANGKWVRKNANEIDPDFTWVDDAYKKNRTILYSEQNQSKALNKMLDDEKLQEINEPTTYDDETGDVKRLGVKGKLATGIVGRVDNPDGTVSYDVYHKNYQLPGTNKDYLDADGKPIKVVSDNVFDKYYTGAVAAKIDKKVDAELEKPSNFNKDGEAMFSPDSDYADMLRRKFMYEELQKATNGRYILNAGDDKSFENRMAVWGRKIQEKNLSLARTRENRQQREFEYKKTKDKDGNEVTIEPYTDRLIREHGVTVHEEGKNYTYTYIPVDKIDKGSYAALTGAKVLPDGKISQEGVKPRKDKSGKLVFIVDEEGNLYGENDQKIDRKEAYMRQIDNIKKDDQKVTIPVYRKILKKVKKYIAPNTKATQKIKGTDKKLF